MTVESDPPASTTRVGVIGDGRAVADGFHALDLVVLQDAVDDGVEVLVDAQRRGLFEQFPSERVPVDDVAAAVVRQDLLHADSLVPPLDLVDVLVYQDVVGGRDGSHVDGPGIELRVRPGSSWRRHAM